jgi:hypothetical protein
MKSVRLHRGRGSVTIRSVSTVAKMNGISPRQVPDLLAAWGEMGAIKKRPDGGFDVLKEVLPKDPRALKIVLRRTAKRPAVEEAECSSES